MILKNVVLLEKRRFLHLLMNIYIRFRKSSGENNVMIDYDGIVP